MTDKEYLAQLKETIENAIKHEKKIDEESKVKKQLNQEYADIYMEYVLNYVRAYNYIDGKIDENKLDKKILAKLGKPKETSCYIMEANNIGEIYVNYSEGLYRKGEPSFKKNKDFDLEIVNSILESCGIYIKEEHTINYDGYEIDVIVFDASEIIKARKQLLKDIENRPTVNNTIEKYKNNEKKR